jgi:hypothetical protein
MKENSIGTLFIVGGFICISIFLIALRKGMKDAQSVKEKWSIFFSVLFDEFLGASGIFYLGLLLILYGWLKNLNLIE